MRIVVACDTYPPDVNGAAVFSGRLAAWLASHGHDIHAITPSPRGRPYVEETNGVIIHRVSSRRYPWHPTFHIADPRRANREVSEAIGCIGPDVVHIQSHFVVGRGASATARKMNIPWIATNHFMPENLSTQLPFTLPRPVFRIAAHLAWRDLGRIYRNATIVTAPTQTAVDLLRHRAGIDGAIAISCGVNMSDFHGPDVDRAKVHAGRVLYVGRLEKEKRVHDILDALLFLDAGITATIVGEGSQKTALRQRAHSSRIAQRVTFLGYVDDARLQAEYARANVFCMPGIAELQSIATLEAMASGLPIVAAEALALPHLVHPGINGALYRPGDTAGLAAALGGILADGDRQRTLGKASRALAAEHDIRYTIEAFEKTYTEVAQVRPNVRNLTPPSAKVAAP
jgi:phosphatidylinositol alpha 1,6-mannosyltransferase